ncbi:hypothetical protein B4135_1886 [Caldibacillus debilis]|uniref:Uncharacterized protein n=1 Tax=Caldibacillus debilis TaxID=301148 RepID=A0A150M7K9_9BACI|nr:hypothetical protein B4135_1886 [Caldibacillus debilis]
MWRISFPAVRLLRRRSFGGKQIFGDGVSEKFSEMFKNRAVGL